MGVRSGCGAWQGARTLSEPTSLLEGDPGWRRWSSGRPGCRCVPIPVANHGTRLQTGEQPPVFLSCSDLGARLQLPSPSRCGPWVGHLWRLSPSRSGSQAGLQGRDPAAPSCQVLRVGPRTVPLPPDPHSCWAGLSEPFWNAANRHEERRETAVSPARSPPLSALSLDGGLQTRPLPVFVNGVIGFIGTWPRPPVYLRPGVLSGGRAQVSSQERSWASSEAPSICHVAPQRKFAAPAPPPAEFSVLGPLGPPGPPGASSPASLLRLLLMTRACWCQAVTLVSFPGTAVFLFAVRAFYLGHVVHVGGGKSPRLTFPLSGFEITRHPNQYLLCSCFTVKCFFIFMGRMFPKCFCNGVLADGTWPSCETCGFFFFKKGRSHVGTAGAQMSGQQPASRTTSP